MSDAQSLESSKHREEDIDLTDAEKQEVEHRQATASRVVHEIIRREGDDELDRPIASLMWSGIAGGVGLCASVLGRGILTEHLPDAPWTPMGASLGYSLGFLIVILGRLQLFTESTLSAVIPVVTHFSTANLARLARLWSVVLAANLAGTLLIAWLAQGGWIGTGDSTRAMIESSRELLAHDWGATLRAGVPAGFLLAAVAWSLPSGRGQEFLIILFFTYFIGLGGFAHVVAGSCEAWLLALSGQASWGWAIGGFIVPALIGNVLGGTVLFALLAHAQVRHEL